MASLGKHIRKRIRPLRRSGGFTLIESQIAVLVFSVGALGVASLQSMSMQSNYEAMQRFQATCLANDVIERMRTNPGARDQYDDGSDSSWRILGGGSITAEPSPDCSSAACTEAQLAARDLWEWEQAIDGSAVKQGDASAAGMNNPTGCIRQTSGGAIEVAIAWRGRREMSNSIAATGCTVDGRYGTSDEFRRAVVVRTFVDDGAE